jgi:molybdate transport system substrate-binding protein
MATRALLGDLLSEYRLAAAQSVQAQAAGGVDVAKRIADGEIFDVVVLAREALDKLISQGHLLPGSCMDLMRSGIAVATRKSAAPLDISSEESVKQAVLSAAALSYSTGPSGVYLEGLFARWGILESVRSRLTIPPPGIAVATLIASGKVELGFQQLSELMAVPGIQVLGSLPLAIQMMTTFSGGICARSASPGTARSLLVYLASAPTQIVKRRHGMEAA